jgi:hypothetical protein
MEIGIIGLPLSGKTTVFNAVTRSNAETAAYATGRVQVQTAVVDVPDLRVGVLSRMFRPRKTVYAKTQFNDITGVSKGSSGGAGLDPQVLNALAKSDALLQVVRAFGGGDVHAGAPHADPAADLEALRLELIISDLAVVERRIERLVAGAAKLNGERRATNESEQALMRRLAVALEEGRLIGDLDLTDDERTLLRGFQFLTAKPALVVANEGEADEVDDLEWANHHRQSSALALKGALEMEIAQLPADEMRAFLASFGIAEPGMNVMVRRCYDLLGVMSFFTVGEDEVRAWTVRRGATALEAAGAIHTDLARGFIRAEVISYEDMIACGTMAEARKRGKLRLEGRDYVVQDGDILNIRFNV